MPKMNLLDAMACLLQIYQGKGYHVDRATEHADCVFSLRVEGYTLVVCNQDRCSPDLVLLGNSESPIVPWQAGGSWMIIRLNSPTPLEGLDEVKKLIEPLFKNSGVVWHDAAKPIDLDKLPKQPVTAQSAAQAPVKASGNSQVAKKRKLLGLPLPSFLVRS